MGQRRKKKGGERDKRGVVGKFAEYDHSNITDSENRRHRGTIRKFKLDLLLVECDTVKTSLSQKG